MFFRNKSLMITFFLSRMYFHQNEMNNIIRPSCFCYYRLEIEFLLCIDCFIGFDTLQRRADNRPIFSTYISHESRSIIVIQLIAPFSPGNVCNNHTNYCYKKPHDFVLLLQLCPFSI